MEFSVQVVDFIVGAGAGSLYVGMQYLYNRYLAPRQYLLCFMARLLVIGAYWSVARNLTNQSYLLFFGGFIFSLVISTILIIQRSKWN